MQHVERENDVSALPFDGYRVLGYEPLEDGLVLLVAGPERLISEQENAVAQVLVKLADQVRGVRHLRAVLAKHAAQPSAEDALAAPLAAAQHGRDLGGPAGVLNGERCPA